MTRKISERGLTLIQSFEGLRLTAYKAVSTEKYYTIGYGHYGADVQKGMTISEEQAESYLKEDVAWAEKHVNSYMFIYNFTQNQFDALVSFTYNVGNITSLTASGTRSLTEIAEKMLSYNKSGGKALVGLTRRRSAEQQLFLSEDDTEEDITYHSALEVACAVLDGKLGNGAERKANIVALGFDYEEVQSKVNLLYDWLERR